jgi:redox-sensing transcriptional repressor
VINFTSRPRTLARGKRRTKGVTAVGTEVTRVPEPTLARLSRYLRCLRGLAEQGIKTVSSAQMEAKLGVLSAQIRKDLSYFGEFGKPGIGYEVQHLLDRLTEIMQLDREQRAVIVGAGNLGSALVGYSGFASSAFRIVGIFDSNFSKIGRMLWDLEIQDAERLPEINRELQASIGIIAVPAAAAQHVADLLIASGICAILNFAPIHLNVPDHVTARNVDFLRELEILSYHLDRPRASGNGAASTR